MDNPLFASRLQNRCIYHGLSDLLLLLDLLRRRVRIFRRRLRRLDSFSHRSCRVGSALADRLAFGNRCLRIYLFTLGSECGRTGGPCLTAPSSWVGSHNRPHHPNPKGQRPDISQPGAQPQENPRDADATTLPQARAKAQPKRPNCLPSPRQNYPS